MTRFQLHVQRWMGGCGDSICDGATKCFLRGSIPCDVLFVGEAPGESEDAIGQPFVGPAGQLLDQIILRSIGEVNLHAAADGMPGISWAFTNLVLCIPREEDGSKFTQPPVEAIISCALRLGEMIELCSPSLIVHVGAMARDWMEPGSRDEVPQARGIPRVSIEHPASVLRTPVAMRDMKIQRTVVALRDAAEELIEERKS